jgi:hypothetical protein
MTLTRSISPKDVLSQVAQALPEACREEVIIVGSLAAGYYFFADDGDKAIRTKDVDCMFSPHAKAVAAAIQVTEQLLAAQWQQRQGTDWSKPGKPEDLTEKLPMVRLRPPEGSDWFIELLGAPDTWVPGTPMKQFSRITTSAGDFAICSFGFLGFAEHDPVMTQYGVRIARPEMMALANMLHHPKIGPELISGTTWKRSNKDLGRVLALAYLTVARDNQAGSDEFEQWPNVMWKAVQSKFPTVSSDLALRAGTGIIALLESPEDLDQALAIANIGLLASLDIGRDAFAATGRRLINEVIEPLAELSRER